MYTLSSQEIWIECFTLHSLFLPGSMLAGQKEVSCHRVGRCVQAPLVWGRQSRQLSSQYLLAWLCHQPLFFWALLTFDRLWDEQFLSVTWVVGIRCHRILWLCHSHPHPSIDLHVQMEKPTVLILNTLVCHLLFIWSWKPKTTSLLFILTCNKLPLYFFVHWFTVGLFEIFVNAFNVKFAP